MTQRVAVPERPMRGQVRAGSQPIASQHWHEETLVACVEYERAEQLDSAVDLCVCVYTIHQWSN